jgi:SAM-dependent methyltransferase
MSLIHPSFQPFLSPVPKVSQEIDPQDEMFTGDESHYFEVGESALRNILLALMSAEVQPNSILDLPCGHGRVLRYIAAKFPEAEITACDLNRPGVDFCSKTFGAKGIYSGKDVQKLNLGDSYDLIWCGSLLTHIEQKTFHEWLYFFSRHLKEKGVLLFTTHGRLSFQNMDLGIWKYGLDTEGIDNCLKGYQNDGYGYANYPNSIDYGISLSSPSWVVRQIESFSEFRLISLAERKWNDHHDVFAIQKITPFDETVPFDEAFYLNQHHDVMSAVQSGSFSSGYEHYRLNGWREGRTAMPPEN